MAGRALPEWGTGAEFGRGARLYGGPLRRWTVHVPSLGRAPQMEYPDLCQTCCCWQPSRRTKEVAQRHFSNGRLNALRKNYDGPGKT